MAVNGKHVLLYAHRMRPEEVDTLGIYGKVHVHSVGYSFSSVSVSTSRLCDDAVSASEANVSKRHSRWQCWIMSLCSVFLDVSHSD